MVPTIMDYIKKQNKEKDNQTNYLSMPLIKPNTLELREYQKNIIESIDNKNTLVVLPTGLGKTIIAIVLTAIRLNMFPDSSVLVLAPTKPLVVQHKKTFMNFLDLPEDRFITVFGNISKEKRKELWKKRGVFFATPQTVKNDIEEGVLSLKEYSLLVVDEAHRSVGDYAYTYLAKKYVEQSNHPLILGLTASPGGEIERIGSVVGNLFIENVEVRSYSDEDVREYIKNIDIKWIHVELNEEYKKVDALLKNALKKRIDVLYEKEFITTKKVSKKELLELQKKLSAKLSKDKSDFLFYILSLIGQSLKITYSIELVETQGLRQFVSYFEKLEQEKNKTKSLDELLNDDDFTSAYLIAKKFMGYSYRYHPKMFYLKDILSKEVVGGRKAIVFTQYVDTAKDIVDFLNNHGFNAVLFIGQRKGYSQKKQIEIIEKFRGGEYDVLVATSVAEEGLDIPAVDVVVFYEPIPSEIRSIQRRGRTGRFDKGSVYVLITKNTLDEVYYWSSIAKERNMRKTLYLLKQMFKQKTKKVTESKKVETLQKYTDKKQVSIVFDSREQKLYELFVSLFSKEGFIINRDVLNIGDVVVNNSVVIERKTAEDFLNSIVDGRLFSQLDKLVYYYDVPVLIIEGSIHDVLKNREIHENVVRGVLSKIAINYHIPVLWSKDIGDTVRYIYFISKRLLEENKNDTYKIVKKPSSLKEQQILLVSSIPDINKTLGERLLRHFKTIKNIANASEERLKEVEGIGDKKAKKIYEIFNEPYDE